MNNDLDDKPQIEIFFLKYSDSFALGKQPISAQTELFIQELNQAIDQFDWYFDCYASQLQYVRRNLRAEVNDLIRRLHSLGNAEKIDDAFEPYWPFPTKQLAKVRETGESLERLQATLAETPNAESVSKLWEHDRPQLLARLKSSKTCLASARKALIGALQ